MTVRQPWAWAIVYLGKDVENRGRSCPWTTAVGERIAIHAAAGPKADSEEFDDAWADIVYLHVEADRDLNFTWEQREYLEGRGTIIGTALVSAVHYSGQCGAHCSLWAFPDQWHIVLGEVRPIARPVPARGMLGLWNLTAEQQRAVERQVA